MSREKLLAATLRVWQTKKPVEGDMEKIKPAPQKAVLPEKAGAACINELNPSVAGLSKGNYSETKTSGIKIRGTGAATKGVMARGPMG